MATRDHAKEIDDVRADLDALRKDIGKLSDSLSSNLAGSAAQVAENARARAGEAVSAASDKARSGAEFVGQKVEERPVTSMAVAFGAGLLIGKLLKR